MSLIKLLLNKFILIIFFYLSILNLVFAQPVITNKRCLGGTGADQVGNLQILKDESYLISGTTTSSDGDITNSFGFGDFWLVNLDTSFNIRWQKSYGGTDTDILHDLNLCKDGGFIMVGASLSPDGDVSSNYGDYDYWIVKTDSFGTIEWKKSYGGSEKDIPNSIQQTFDGGYIVAGGTSSNNHDVTGLHDTVDVFGVITPDCWILKLNNYGDIEWTRVYGGSELDVVNSIQQTTDSGFIVAASSKSNNGDIAKHIGLTDCWIYKLDKFGNIQWQKTYGGTRVDEPISIQNTNDGGFIFAGYSESNNGDLTLNHGYSDYWIVKLNSSGDIEWQKSYGGSSIDLALTVDQTKDDHYIISGYTNSNDGDIVGYHDRYDYWIIKLDTNGNLEWNKIIGGSGSEGPYCSFKQTTLNNYFFAGSSISNDGDLTDSNCYGDQAGDFFVAKINDSNVSTEDLYSFTKPKLKYYISENILHVNIVNGVSFPNDVAVYDLYGKQVYVQLNNGQINFEMNLSNNSNGIYIVEVIEKKKLYNFKIFYQR
jgi:hypothetical protein